MSWIGDRIAWIGLLVGSGLLLVDRQPSVRPKWRNAGSRCCAGSREPELDQQRRPAATAALRGSVVLLEFWTFDCINCIHTLPHVEQWYQDYRDQGLVVLGIHYPEFGYEHDLQNVLAATQRLNVTYPVGIDNDGATWNAYNQRYWPTLYLIDKQGQIRYLRIGEGNYEATEAAHSSAARRGRPPAPARQNPPPRWLISRPTLLERARRARRRQRPNRRNQPRHGAGHSGRSGRLVSDQLQRWHRLRLRRLCDRPRKLIAANLRSV